MRSKIKCGNCGREFYAEWYAGEHICKEQLSFLDRIREWGKFRNISKLEKMRYLAMNDPEFFKKFMVIEEAVECFFAPDKTHKRKFIPRIDKARYELDEDYKLIRGDTE